MLCPPLVRPLLLIAFSIYFAVHQLVESVEDVFTKRISGPKLSHLNYFGRLELFCAGTLEGRRIKPDSVLLCSLFVVS